jgi:DNA-binding SARP family transcriptional activator
MTRALDTLSERPAYGINLGMLDATHQRTVRERRPLAGAVVVRVCGPLQVAVGTDAERHGPTFSLGSRKARTLLAVLAARRGRTVSGEQIVAALWAGTRPRHPADNVATLVSRLRAAVGPDVVVGGRDGYRLGTPPAVLVDVDMALDLASGAESGLAVGRGTEALAPARRALALVGTEDALAGQPDAEWLVDLRREVDDLRRRLRHLVAEAALAVGDSATAINAARMAASADSLDDRAHRTLMAAHRAAGEPDRALSAYARLRSALAAELGVDPAPETQRLHEAILRGEGPRRPARPAYRARRGAASPVGRDTELARLAQVWQAAAAGTPGVHLVVGEAGIGKTTLAEAAADAAARAGAQVFRSRCHAAERSLFLQPVVDALAPDLLSRPSAEVRELAGGGAGDLVALIPELAAVLGPEPHARRTPELARRRTFDALRDTLTAAAARQPVLLLLDDLQDAGSATVELVHYIAQRSADVPLLVLATVRVEEGVEALELLGDVAGRTDVGPLDAAAVGLLAARAGSARLADDIMRRTRGHPLFVVESLRALQDGDRGVPLTLQATVTSRLRHVGPRIERVLRAAATLDDELSVEIVAAMLDQHEEETAGHLEGAVAARLLTPAGDGYEFVNDLVQEVVRETTAAAVRTAHHRRAVALLADRPEALARHAAEIGDWPRAARAWLVAGQRAVGRYAARDAKALLDAAEYAAARVDDAEITGRVRLVRARAWHILGSDTAADAEHRGALAAFRTVGRDERRGSRAAGLAGDPADGAVAARPALSASQAAGEAVELAAEADLCGWRAVIAANQLCFDDAVALGVRAVAAARAAADDDALTAGLDGLKTAYAYTGDVAALRGVLEELEPLARRRGELQLLFWTMFESALPHVAAADWERATERFTDSIEVDRRTWPGAHEAWCLAHLGWVARLRGRPDDAVELSRRAQAAVGDPPHPWWDTAALALFGTALLERDAPGDREAAVGPLRTALDAARGTSPAAYLLRCMAPLAEATGDPVLLAEADALLDRVTAPPGGAWLACGDVYLALARAWLRQDEPERATVVIRRLVRAADRHGWRAWQAAGRLVEASARCRTGDLPGARDTARGALTIAEGHGMPRLAEQAAQLLARVG